MEARVFAESAATGEVIKKIGERVALLGFLPQRGRNFREAVALTS
jgi:hypothetical protein